MVSTAGIVHDDQWLLGEEKVYFILQLSGQIPPLEELRAGTQGRNLQAGTEAEAMEELESASTVFPTG